MAPIQGHNCRRAVNGGALESGFMFAVPCKSVYKGDIVEMRKSV